MIYDTMTREESCGVLDELLAEFPFADEGRSKSVQIAAMLSLFCLQMLSRKAQVPMFVYTSNSQRSGKTLLAKTAIIPVMGAAAAQTLSGEDEELRKVLDAVVRDGSPYLLLDNLKRRITSDALEAFCTSASWSGRVLGSSRTFVMEKQTVIFLTANHAQVSTDIAGRALFVDLWIPEADPQSRMVKRVMDDAYLARPDVRQRALSALWGLVRHWDAAGRPQGPSRLAGYEEWSRMVGGIVTAAGYADPLTRPEMDTAGDPDAENMQELARLLSEMDQPEAGFEFHKIIEVCQEKNLFEHIIEGKWFRPSDEPPYYEPSAKCKSRMGKLMTSYDGRMFRYKDGTAITFGKRGRNRQRRYRVHMEVTGS
jgi:hypothetical protein